MTTTTGWRRVWHDPVWSKVIAGLLLLALGAIAAYLLDWWPAIGQALLGAWQFLWASSSLPNWLIGVLSLFALLMILFAIGLGWVLVHVNSEPAEHWRRYTSDQLLALRWRWDYRKDGSIHRLTTYCPYCDYQVFPEDSYQTPPGIAFRCDSCGRDLAKFDESHTSLESKVERFIHQKLRNGTWKDALDAGRF